MPIRTKRVWTFQNPSQLAKHGKDGASWFIGFIDLRGKRRQRSCGIGATGKKLASKLRLQLQAQLISGTFESDERKDWSDFRKEYMAKIGDAMEPGTRENTVHALDVFERLIKPKQVGAISSRTIADYVALRREEKRSRRSEVNVRPATINKELRHLRAVLRKANKWDYLPKLPDIAFLKEQKRIPTYVTPEDFGLIYGACAGLKEPRGQLFAAADWWRGLLMFAYMTGWRIGSILSLQWEDVDLDASTALSRAQDNKGRRDQRIPLHPVVIEHLRKLRSFSPTVFPWTKNRRKLFTHLHHLQEAAGVKPEGDKPYFGFHDFRRAFATMNAGRMTADALQVLMQHKDYQTTQRYVNLARQLNPAIQDLYVPAVGIKLELG
jgi:integrase